VTFFSEAEQEGMRVSRMILHVVGRQDEHFVPEPETEVQEEVFFRSRILAEAGDAVHAFADGSMVKPVLERMARDEITFEEGGQELSQLFARDHVRQATSGAFFVFQLDVGDEHVRLYAMIKYDYREVVELSQAQGRNVLRAIVQAFVKERKAVQKICVVRLVDGVAEDMVSASDRMHVAPDLTDYFARYLGVSRARSDGELSNRLNEAMRRAMTEVKEHLPDRDVPGALRRMKQALQPRGQVTNEDVVDAALHAANRPENERVRATLEAKTRKHLRQQDLDDVAFTPEARIFAVRPREWVRTAEEVRIEYPAEQLGQTVNRIEQDGRIIFTITTRQIVDDGTVSNRPRPNG
jgi:hypothetical protein